MATPRKTRKKICVVCKTDRAKETWRLIHSEAGVAKNLAEYLKKYGEIEVLEGYLCRTCEKRLLKLVKSSRDFREQCNRNIHLISGKRCSLDLDENLPRSRVKLFETPADSSRQIISNVNVQLSPISIDCTITPVAKYAPLLPKSPDDGYCSSSPGTTTHKQTDSDVDPLDSPDQLLTPKPAGWKLHKPNELFLLQTARTGNNAPVQPPTFSEKTVSQSCPDDHKYGKQRKPSVRKTAKKDVDVPDVLETVLNNIKYPDSDTLTNVECSLIQAVLPLRSRSEFVKTILNVPALKKTVKCFLLAELSKDNVVLRSRKIGKTSELMKKTLNNLKNFTWETVIQELAEELPLLAEVLVAAILPERLNSAKKKERLASAVPRLGMVYAILAQTRNPELSKVQRCISMLLFDSICDQKVFDRLHPLGLCLSYGHSLNILDSFGGSFNASVIDSIKQGKRIRLVGDNINWRTSVHDERQDRHEHLNHAFGSAVVVQNVNFSHLSSVTPQNPYSQMNNKDFLLSADEWTSVKFDYALLISTVVARHIPALAFLRDHFPKRIESTYSKELQTPNKVIPLPVLHYNEQKYDDVVQIMDFYEKFVHDTYDAAGVPKPKIHTGGDQLTRERFSGAKRLRAGGLTKEERFGHLSPITFELFHMMMNYASLIFKQLYKSSSETDIGTMKCEQNRILRTKVNENINDNYDADKDFIVSFVDSYIVEAVLDYFGMTSASDVPKKNLPPPFNDSFEASAWAKEHLTAVVDTYVGKTFAVPEAETVEEDGLVMTLQLSNGDTKTIMMRKIKKAIKEDSVKNYGHLTLELGLMFKSLLDLCKNPNRERGLRLMKLAMTHFKANNWLSKYASEIMRFLVHQMCILSEREAHEEFYGLFVNTKGGVGNHIPCDLQMEFLVKQVKKNIKHMFSNKTEKNITVRTSALPALSDIGEVFDKNSNVITRAKKHSDIDSKRDESAIISDLRQLRPFKLEPGRSHRAFPNVAKTITMKLDPMSFHKWVADQKNKFATEIGI